MENTLHTCAHLQANGLISNVALDDLKIGVVGVLGQIFAPAYGETIQHANASAFAQKSVNQVAADESGTSGNQIQQRISPLENPVLQHIV
jgi:uncharacterized protein YvpB